jgi:tetratricopeptide (TPR) repeat protein
MSNSQFPLPSFDNPLTDELSVLQTLLAKLNASAEGVPDATWDDLFAASARDERLGELASAFITMETKLKPVTAQAASVFLLRAAMFFRAMVGDMKRAGMFLERAVQLNPLSDAALSALEIACADAGDFAKLADVLVQTASKRGREAGAPLLVRAASAFGQAGKLEKELSTLLDVLRARPLERSARSRVAELYASQGKFRDLAKLLEQDLSQLAGNAEVATPEDVTRVRVELIRVYSADIREPERALPHAEAVLAAPEATNDDKTLAREVLSQLLSNKSHALRASAALGKDAELAGDFDQSLRYLNIEVEGTRGPKRRELLIRQGDLRTQLFGFSKEAYDSYEAALLLDASDPLLRQKLLRVAMETGLAAEAAKALGRTAPSLKDAQVKAQVAIDTGELLLAAGDPKRAKQAVASAIPVILPLAETERAQERARDQANPKPQSASFGVETSSSDPDAFLDETMSQVLPQAVSAGNVSGDEDVVDLDGEPLDWTDDGEDAGAQSLGPNTVAAPLRPSQIRSSTTEPSGSRQLELRRALNVLYTVVREEPDRKAILDVCQRLAIWSETSDERERFRLESAELAYEVADFDSAKTDWSALLESRYRNRALVELANVLRARKDTNELIRHLQLQENEAKDRTQAKAFATERIELVAANESNTDVGVAAFEVYLETYGSSLESLAIYRSFLERKRATVPLGAVMEREIAFARPEERGVAWVSLANYHLEKTRDLDAATRAFTESFQTDASETASSILERLLERPELQGFAAKLLEPHCRSVGDSPRLLRLLVIRAESTLPTIERLDAMAEAADLARSIEQEDVSVKLVRDGFLLACQGNVEIEPWLVRFETRLQERDAAETEIASELLRGIPKSQERVDFPLVPVALRAVHYLEETEQARAAAELLGRILPSVRNGQEILERIAILLDRESLPPAQQISLYLDAQARLQRTDAGVERDRDLVDLRVRTARLQRHELGDLKAAAATFESVFEIDAKHEVTRLEIKEVYQELNDDRALARVLHRVIAAFSDAVTAEEQAVLRAERLDLALLSGRLLPSAETKVQIQNLLDDTQLEGSDVASLEPVVTLLRDPLLTEKWLLARLRLANPETQGEWLEKLGAAAPDEERQRDYLQRALANAERFGDEVAFVRLGHRLLEDQSQVDLKLLEKIAEREARISPPSVAGATYEKLVAATRELAEHVRLLQLLGELYDTNEPKQALDAWSRALALRPGDEVLLGRVLKSSRNAEAEMVAARLLRSLAEAPEAGGARAALHWGYVQSLVSLAHRGTIDSELVPQLRIYVEDATLPTSIRVECDRAIDDLLTARRTEAGLTEFRRWYRRRLAEGATSQEEVVSALLRAGAEETDLDHAAELYERVRTLDAENIDALLSLARIESARGNHAASAKTILDLIPLAKGRARAQAELALAQMRRRGELGDVDVAGAIDALRSALTTDPAYADTLTEILEVAREASRATDGKIHASALSLLEYALEIDALSRDQLLSLPRIAGDAELRLAWHRSVVELPAALPEELYARATRAAEEFPQDDGFWDAAEGAAQLLSQPDTLRSAFERTMRKDIARSTKVLVAERAARFMREWYEEPQKRIAFASILFDELPQEDWVFDEYRLLLDGEGQFARLFDAYDRKIAFTSGRAKQELLSDAARAAKDFAKDDGRAIGYFEMLLSEKRNPRTEVTLERLYERAGRYQDLLALYWSQLTLPQPDSRGVDSAPPPMSQDRFALKLKMATVATRDLGSSVAADAVFAECTEEDLAHPDFVQSMEAALRASVTNDEERQAQVATCQRLAAVYRKTERHAELLAVKLSEDRVQSLEPDSRLEVAQLAQRLGKRELAMRALLEAFSDSRLHGLPANTVQKLGEALEQAHDASDDFAELEVVLRKAAAFSGTRHAGAIYFLLARIHHRIHDQIHEAWLTGAEGLECAEAASDVALERAIAGYLEPLLPPSTDDASEELNSEAAEDTDSRASALASTSVISASAKLAASRLFEDLATWRVVEYILARYTHYADDKASVLRRSARLAMLASQGSAASALWEDFLVADAASKTTNRTFRMEALSNLVRLNDQLGEREGLIRALLARAELRGPVPESRSDLMRAASVMSAELNQFARAVEVWKQIESRFGSTSAVALSLASLFERMNDKENLVLHLTQAIELSRNSADRADALALRGRAEKRLNGDAITALASFAEALTLVPDHTLARTEVMDLVADANHRASAVSILLRALNQTNEWKPKLALTEDRLLSSSVAEEQRSILMEAAALAEEQAGDLKLAFDYARRALLIDPDYEEAEVASYRLAGRIGQFPAYAKTLDAALRAVYVKYNDNANAEAKAGEGASQGKRKNKGDQAKPQASQTSPIAWNVAASRLHMRLGHVLEVELLEAANARTHYAEVLQREPTNRKAALGLVRTASRTGEADAVVWAVLSQRSFAEQGVDTEMLNALTLDTHGSKILHHLDAGAKRLFLTGEMHPSARLFQLYWVAEAFESIAAFTDADAILEQALELDSDAEHARRVQVAFRRRVDHKSLHTSLFELGTVIAIRAAAQNEPVPGESYALRREAFERAARQGSATDAESLLDRLGRDSGEDWRRAVIEEQPSEFVRRAREHSMFCLAEQRQRLTQSKRFEELAGLLRREQALPYESAEQRELACEAADVLLHALNDGNASVTIVEAWFERDPKNDRVFALLTDGLRKIRDFVRLAQVYRIRAESTVDEVSVSASMQYAEVQFELGKVEDAGQSLRSALKQYRSLLDTSIYGDARVLLVDLLARSKQLEALESVLAEEAAVAEETGLSELAMDLYRRAARTAIDLRENPSSGIKHLESLANLSRDPAVFDELAQLNTRLGQYESAVLHLEQLRTLAPVQAKPSVFVRLADALTLAGEGEFARTRLELLLREAPEEQKIRRKLIRTYRTEGDEENLKKALEEAADFATDVSEQLESLREAAELHRVAKPEKTAELLGRAAKLSPDDKQLRMQLAEALGLAGQRTAAEAILQEILDSFGARKPKEKAVAHFYLARLHLSAADPESRRRALAELETASRIDPTYGPAIYQLATVAEELGEFERAERAYRSLLQASRKVHDGSPEGLRRAQILYRLSRLAEKQDDYEKADEVFETALEAAIEDDDEMQALLSSLGVTAKEVQGERASKQYLRALEQCAQYSERTAWTLELAKLLEDKEPARAFDLSLRALATGEELDHSVALAERLAEVLPVEGKTDRDLRLGFGIEQALLRRQVRHSLVPAPSETQSRLWLRAGILLESNRERALGALRRARDTASDPSLALHEILRQLGDETGPVERAARIESAQLLLSLVPSDERVDLLLTLAQLRFIGSGPPTSSPSESELDRNLALVSEGVLDLREAIESLDQSNASLRPMLRAMRPSHHPTMGNRSVAKLPSEVDLGGPSPDLDEENALFANLEMQDTKQPTIVDSNAPVSVAPKESVRPSMLDWSTGADVAGVEAGPETSAAGSGLASDWGSDSVRYALNDPRDADPASQRRNESGAKGMSQERQVAIAGKATSLLRDVTDRFPQAQDAVRLYDYVTSLVLVGDQLLDADARIDSLGKTWSLQATVVDPLREAVSLAIAQNKIPAAETLLRRVIEETPDDELAIRSWALQKLARLRDALDDHAGALTFLREAASMEEGDAARDLYLGVADKALQLGDDVLASQTYLHLLDDYPSDVRVFRPLASIFRRTKQYDRLDVMLESVLPHVVSSEDRAALRMERVAWLSETRGAEHPDVTAALRAIVMEEERSEEAASALAANYERAADLDNLLWIRERVFEKVRESEDVARFESAALALAELRDRRGEVSEGEALLREALALRSESSAILEGLVRYAYNRKDFPAVEDLLSRLLALAMEVDAIERLALGLADVRTSLNDLPAAVDGLDAAWRRVEHQGTAGDRAASPLLLRLLSLSSQLPATNRYVECLLKRSDLLLASTTEHGADASRLEAVRTESIDLRVTAAKLLHSLRNPSGAAEAMRAVHAQAPEIERHVLQLCAYLTEAERLAEVSEVLRAYLSVRYAQSASGQALKPVEAALALVGAELDQGLIAQAEESLRLYLPEASREVDEVEEQVCALLDRAAFFASDAGDKPAHKRLILEQVRRLERMGNRSATRPLLERAQLVDPDDREVAVHLARVARESGDLEAAIQSLQRLSELETGSVLAQTAIELFACVDGLSQWQIAIPSLERARREESAADYHGRIEEALLHGYACLGDRANYASIAEAMGLRAAQQGAFEPALKSFLEGAAALLTGDTQSAFSATEVTPEGAAMASNLYDRALAVKPGDVEITCQSVVAYIYQGRLEEASAVLSDAITRQKGKRSKELAMLYHKYAQVARAAGDEENDMSSLGFAFDIDPQNGDVASELSLLAMQVGNYELATKALRAVTMLRTPASMSKAEANQYLGEIAYSQGDPKKAMLLIKRALEEDPNLERARDLLETLKQS